MAQYVKATNFAVKDSLASGNPAKIVKGTEIDTEFNAIASAIASKPDADSPTLTGTPLAPTATTATNNTQIASTAYVVNRIAQDIAGKANIASPTFTGTPAAPTAASGTNTTQLATTAFVAASFNNAALTGTPTAPTAAVGTNSTQIATTAFVTTALGSALLGQVYPVGSIYINATNSANPNTLLGFGTWVAFGAGRVPVGFNAGDPLFDAAEETGGSKDAIVVSHTHTFTGSTNSAGVHTHGLPTYSLDGSSLSFNAQSSPTFSNASTASAGAHTHTVSGTTDTTGSSGTNANLQPYITVYMWKRTA